MFFSPPPRPTCLAVEEKSVQIHHSLQLTVVRHAWDMLLGRIALDAISQNMYRKSPLELLEWKGKKYTTRKSREIE